MAGAVFVHFSHRPPVEDCQALVCDFTVNGFGEVCRAQIIEEAQAVHQTHTVHSANLGAHLGGRP